MSADVYVVDGKRTPFGSFGGILSDIPSTTLAATVITGLLQGSALPAAAVDEVIIGQVLAGGPFIAGKRHGTVLNANLHSVVFRKRNDGLPHLEKPRPIFIHGFRPITSDKGVGVFQSAADDGRGRWRSRGVDVDGNRGHGGSAGSNRRATDPNRRQLADRRRDTTQVVPLVVIESK